MLPRGKRVSPIRRRLGEDEFEQVRKRFVVPKGIILSRRDLRTQPGVLTPGHVNTETRPERAEELTDG